MTRERLDFIESCIERKLYPYEINLLNCFERVNVNVKRDFSFRVARKCNDLNITYILLAYGLYEEYLKEVNKNND